jgi:mannose-6-phosphate isomerase-like protein (cupin superfamily)
MSEIVRLPKEGKAISYGGFGVVFKISGEVTGDAFAIVEHPIDPGILILPHVHDHEDELSYVLEGTIGARIGDQEFEAAPGAYIFKPRGVLHTFWNPGPVPARIIEIISPPHFAEYFEEAHQLAEFGADNNEFTKLNKNYGLIFDSQWVPELKKKYGLTLLGEHQEA